MVYVRVKVIKTSCLVKDQSKIIFLVNSQSKYLVGPHFNLGRRSEDTIYRSATPLSDVCETDQTPPLRAGVWLCQTNISPCQYYSS